MGCSSCGRRPSKFRQAHTPTHVTEEPVAENLSAPRLTPMGWVRTCSVCGVVSEPQSFAVSIKPACNCHNM